MAATASRTEIALIETPLARSWIGTSRFVTLFVSPAMTMITTGATTRRPLRADLQIDADEAAAARHRRRQHGPARERDRDQHGHRGESAANGMPTPAWAAEDAGERRADRNGDAR